MSEAAADFPVDRLGTDPPRWISQKIRSGTGTALQRFVT
jgi:hypothetical protein